MHLSQSATVITIGLLLACATSSAEERSASSSQRYLIHVPSEVKFGQLQPAVASEPAAQPAEEDAEPLVFMAETTSGMTIQFETQSDLTTKLPLKLSVGGSQQGTWWANNTNDATASTHEAVAEGTSVQASTLSAGWTTLKIITTNPPTASDDTMTTIVVTIVAH